MGEMGLCVEYGDETELELSFRVTALSQAVAAAEIPGVLDYVVTIRSLGIIFDPGTISRADLSKEVAAISDGLEVEHGVLASRLLVLPVWYDDPWSAETAVRNNVPRNIDLVAEHNGLTIEELVQVHSGTDHWVGAVGGNPGSYLAYALDPAYALGAPKYDNPRTSTPPGCVAVGGRETSTYPCDGAGGFQLIGRTPYAWWDPTQSNKAFADAPALTRVGDRLRFVAIDEDEYRRLDELVQAEKYEYDIREETFDIAAWIAERQAAA
jgi:KipI family sensor histidine kinase inhibitor